MCKNMTPCVCIIKSKNACILALLSLNEKEFSVIAVRIMDLRIFKFIFCWFRLLKNSFRHMKATETIQISLGAYIFMGGGMGNFKKINY